MSEYGYSLIVRPNPMTGDAPHQGPWLVSQGHGWDRQDVRGTMDCGPRAATEWFFTHLISMTHPPSQHSKRPRRRSRTRHIARQPIKPT